MFQRRHVSWEGRKNKVTLAVIFQRRHVSWEGRKERYLRPVIQDGYIRVIVSWEDENLATAIFLLTGGAFRCSPGPWQLLLLILTDPAGCVGCGIQVLM